MARVLLSEQRSASLQCTSPHSNKTLASKVKKIPSLVTRRTRDRQKYELVKITE